MENLRNYFFDPMEKERAVLGERYLMSLIKNGNTFKPYCILTDQRLYVSGKHYNKDSGFVFSTKDNVSLRLDIIHSMENVKRPRFIYTVLFILSIFIALINIPGLVYYLYILGVHRHTNSAAQILLYITSIILVPGSILIIRKFHRKEMLMIYYDEGAIALNTANYDAKEIKEFLDELKLAKDEFAFAKSKQLEPLENRDYNSIADEIQRYKQLLDNGVIDEDEYRVMKNRLIQMPSRF